MHQYIVTILVDYSTCRCCERLYEKAFGPFSDESEAKKWALRQGFDLEDFHIYPFLSPSDIDSETERNEIRMMREYY